MSVELETTNCDLCGSEDTNALIQARDYRYGRSDIFNIVKCKNCGLIYLNPRPTAASLLKQWEEVLQAANRDY